MAKAQQARTHLVDSCLRYLILLFLGRLLGDLPLNLLGFFAALSHRRFLRIGMHEKGA